MSGVNLSSQALAEDYDEDSKSISNDELGNVHSYGRRIARWLGGDEEVYVRDNTDIEDESDYTVEYRDGRFGSDTVAELDDLENALEEGREIAEENLSAHLQ